jgi:tRNA pseudouridine38-40 synthase
MATKQRAILIALNNNDDDNDINVNDMKDIERNDFTNPNHWRHQSYIDSLENTETSLQSELYKERTGRNFVYRGIVSYDGTRYKGFQKQGEEVMTVQSELERALMQITSCDRELLCLGGAGRTDAGVHAERQIIHFYTKEPLKDEKNCMRAMNRLLHEDVRVLEIAKPHQMFHSRFHAIEKTYRYTIDFGLPSSPFHRTRALSVGYREYDLELIEQACKIFIGTHDFSAFMNRSRDGKNLESNSERTIYSFDVVRGSGLSLSDDGNNNNNNNNNNNKYDDGSSSLVHLYVTGNGFLYRQVRNMVGAILAVGGGRFSLDELKILMEKRDRKLLPTAAPAKGLCLYDVKYPKEMLYYTEE